MSVSPSISAVIAAAGSGTRFGAARPKQLALLGGRPVLSRTLSVFENHPDIFEIVLVLPPDWMETCLSEAVRPFGFKKVRAVAGGASRAQSTALGFAETRGELVLIHDGVRPLVTPDLIGQVARAARAQGAALAAVPVSDTLKLGDGGLACGTVPRENLWRAQTPQGFRREILAEALALAGGDDPTDDIALVERLGLKAALVPSFAGNLKITTPEDLRMAEAILAGSGLRVGQGYDLHRLVPGRPLFLGCLEIPFEAGLLGHSDADVMAHALIDALLGAAGLGDIGFHFSDKDARWAGARGSLLLAESMALVRKRGFELVNADVTLIGEKPKIGPYRQAMAEALAEALGVGPDLINVKATTTEGLGATGRGEALAAQAVAALRAAV